MKLKIDASGNAVLIDGMPVYVYEDGTEKPFDAAKASDAIKRLNGEAKAHRERAEAAEDKVKQFDGLDDPEEARKALETVKSMDGKIKADVDRVRAEVAKAMTAKIEAAEQRAASIEKRLNDELVGGNFARSKFIGDKLAIPSDLAQSAFGRHFSVVDGQLVAKDAAGNPILTREGTPASFDEALETLVGGYAHRDSILKADQKGGTGAQPGTGGGKGTGKTMPRAEFDRLSPPERSKTISAGVLPVD